MLSLKEGMALMSHLRERKRQTETETETDRNRDRERQRQRKRQRERAERQREAERESSERETERQRETVEKIDSGKNWIDPSDIFDALHFGSGVYNVEVCIAEINKDIASMIGPKSQLNNFHSIKLEESGMVLW